MRKPNYFYKQSAVVPFRIKDKKAEVLLITSRKKRKWIIPKGIIEQNLTPQESALKEAIEEAGIDGNVIEKLFAQYDYKKWGDTCSVKVYLMEVTKVLDKWMEDFRERKWLPVEDAIKKTENEELKKILRQLESKIQSLGYKINGK